MLNCPWDIPSDHSRVQVTHSRNLLHCTVTMAAQHRPGGGDTKKKKTRLEKSISQPMMNPSGRASFWRWKRLCPWTVIETNLATVLPTSDMSDARICHKWKSTSHMTIKLMTLTRSHHFVASTSQRFWYSSRASRSPSDQTLNLLLKSLILEMMAEQAELKIKFMATLTKAQ